MWGHMNSVMDPNLLHLLLQQAPFLDVILPVLELDDEKQRRQGHVDHSSQRWRKARESI